ncbi:MBOAT family protein [bacterium]|nr:MBOAT family protein [bacterium]
MVFSSNIFLYLFLPIVLAGYFVCVALRCATGLGRIPNLWLLSASLFFYAWGAAWLCGVMLLAVAIDYAAGLAIAGVAPWGKKPVETLSAIEPRSLRQRLALVAALTANLAILAFFKYFNFGIDSYNALVEAAGLDSLACHAALRIALPLGISFFTFQAMSYTIDVYLGKIAATRNLVDYLTFGAFFPVLISGPILRYENVADDLANRKTTLDDFAAGARRFIVGLAKKILIANVVAAPADQIFALPKDEVTAALAWLAVFSYTLQIYFDFSGYSDMAIGLARMFGFRLPENFNYPYVSRSIAEFWRRWHISLSSWFRDYVFMPLNMAWREWMLPGTIAAIIITFLLTGLWHGANWTFVIWGAYHGGLIAIERLVGLDKKGGWRDFISPLRHVYALLVIMFGWMLFRSESFHQATYFARAMTGLSQSYGGLHGADYYLTNKVLAAMAAGIVAATPIYPWLKAWRARLAERPGRLMPAAVSAISVALLLLVFGLCAMELAALTHNAFIYFRF